MEAFGNDPQQEAVDAAVAAMVATAPNILTPDKAEANQAAGPFGSAHLEPSERFRLARERRIAFDRAMAAVRSRGRADVLPIRDAVGAADADAIVTAAVSYAVGAFCDEQMGREGTLLHGLNAALLNEFQAAIWADAARILETVTEDGSAEVAWIRAEARAAVTPQQRVFDSSGRPAPAQRSALSRLTTLVRR